MQSCRTYVIMVQDCATSAEIDAAAPALELLAGLAEAFGGAGLIPTMACILLRCERLAAVAQHLRIHRLV